MATVVFNRLGVSELTVQTFKGDVRGRRWKERLTPERAALLNEAAADPAFWKLPSNAGEPSTSQDGTETICFDAPGTWIEAWNGQRFVRSESGSCRSLPAYRAMEGALLDLVWLATDLEGGRDGVSLAAIRLRISEKIAAVLKSSGENESLDLGKYQAVYRMTYVGWREPTFVVSAMVAGRNDGRFVIHEVSPKGRTMSWRGRLRDADIASIEAAASETFWSLPGEATEPPQEILSSGEMEVEVCADGPSILIEARTPDHSITTRGFCPTPDAFDAMVRALRGLAIAKAENFGITPDD